MRALWTPCVPGRRTSPGPRRRSSRRWMRDWTRRACPSSSSPGRRRRRPWTVTAARPWGRSCARTASSASASGRRAFDAVRANLLVVLLLPGVKNLGKSHVVALGDIDAGETLQGLQGLRFFGVIADDYPVFCRHPGALPPALQAVDRAGAVGPLQGLTLFRHLLFPAGGAIERPRRQLRPTLNAEIHRHFPRRMARTMAQATTATAKTSRTMMPHATTVGSPPWIRPALLIWASMAM